MKSKKKKTWVYQPSKKPKPKVPDGIKQRVKDKGDEIVEKIFKPEYVKPAPKEFELNHLVDIYTKWYGNYFYFCSKYECPPGSIASSFESKFARMEYHGKNEFELSYMRHTEKWFSLGKGSMEDCLKRISDMVPY